GLLELGRRRPQEAVPHLEAVVRQQREQGWCDAAVTPHVSTDLVEAYVMDGRPAAASDLLDAFESDARRAGRPSALAAAARCRGLHERADQVEHWFGVALAFGRHEVSAFERARTQLLFAERLRELGR